MSLVYKWKIIYSLRVADDLRGFPKVLQKRIVKKMRFFVSSENPMRFAQKVKDKLLGEFRFRVGDYRVVVDIIAEKKEIIVLKIGKRDEVYK